MKTAKRVLAILMAMLMAVSAFAVAASAAESIAAQLASGDYASISQNTKESIVITKDATIDLGGKILKSANGSPAITVKNGATVTIQNGYVESYYKSYSGVTPELLDGIVNSSPAGIVAYGAGSKVILKDVRVMGGMVRIPTTTEWFVPTGSAVKVYGGAEVELDGAVLIGSYGVSNDPADTGKADGKVIIDEAIVIGYLDYVKRVYNGVVYDAETVEKVNAADRIAGYLNSNVKLTSSEQDLVDLALDDRVYIFTKKPVDDQAIVTLNKNTGTATITASTVNHMEREIGVPKSTDCSYRYVPYSAYDVESGKTYALDTAYPVAELEGKEIRINYRLQFELKGDVKKYANNFDYYYNKAYNKAVSKADSVYKTALKEYDKFIAQVVDLYKQVDEAGQKTVTIDGDPVIVNGQPANLSNMLGDDFYFILRSILTVGGVTMYEGATGLNFTTKRFSDLLYNNGEAAPDPAEYTTGAEHPDWDIEGEYAPYYDVEVLGTLDKVQALVDGFKAIKGDASFGDQSKWNAYAHYVLDNYDDVLDLFDELYTKINKLKADLTDPDTQIGQAIEQLGMSDKLGQLDEIIDALKDADIAVDTALSNEIVQQVRAKIDAHANDGTVETYMAKVIAFVNDYRVYFTPENFLAEDGKFGLAYTLDGPTKTVVIEKGLLNVSVIGDGVVNYVSDNAPADKADTFDWTTVPYNKAVTLNAVAAAGNEFLYYVDSYTQRIISTNPTLVVDTKIERYVEAVFESLNTSKVVFTNNSGVICEDLPYSATIDASGVEAPVAAGYDLLGWGPKGVMELTSADFVSAYKSGSSAFEDGATYNINGFAFKLNSSTSNKYVAIPKLEAAQTFTVTFVDNGQEWSKTVNIGGTVSYTAQGDGFKYWKNDQNQIVSVYRSYSVQAFQQTTLTAVYEGEASEYGYVNLIAAIEEDVRVRVYAERSIPANWRIISVGAVVSYTDDVQNPTVADINNDTVKAVYTTKKTSQGILSFGMTRASLARNNGVGYARGFVEIETDSGSYYVYSAAKTVRG